MKQLTPKQAKFLAVYLETGNGAEAYRQAYDTSKMMPTTINRRVTDLLKHGEIKARIENALQQIADKTIITVEGLTKDLVDTAKEARQGDGWSAAASCYKTIAMLHGLLIRQMQDVTKAGEFRVVRRLPDSST